MVSQYVKYSIGDNNKDRKLWTSEINRHMICFHNKETTAKFIAFENKKRDNPV